MKYQYKLNGNIIFETDDCAEYMKFILADPQIRSSILYNLLDKAGEYTCNMVTAK